MIHYYISAGHRCMRTHKYISFRILIGQLGGVRHVQHQDKYLVFTKVTENKLWTYHTHVHFSWVKQHHNFNAKHLHAFHQCILFLLTVLLQWMTLLLIALPLNYISWYCGCWGSGSRYSQTLSLSRWLIVHSFKMKVLGYNNTLCTELSMFRSIVSFILGLLFPPFTFPTPIKTEFSSTW